jgi:hypothetical protein
MMAPADVDHTGARLPGERIVLSDFDGPLDAHLEQLGRRRGAGIDTVFGTARYPQASHASDRLDYLRWHTVQRRRGT